MFAARQRARCLARQLPRSTRSYASDHHHHSEGASESFGKGSIALISAALGSVLLYQFAPRQGDESGITKAIERWTSSPKDWEEMNAAHSLAAKQAGFDRNLFENETPKNRWVDVAYPEALQSHCNRNIRAGHINNIDAAVAHYKDLHNKEQERKIKNMESN